MNRVGPASPASEMNSAVKDDARDDTLHVGKGGLHEHAGEPEKSTGAKNRGPAHEGNLNGAIDPQLPRLHCNWRKRRCHLESKCIAITQSSKDDCVGFVPVTGACQPCRHRREMLAGLLRLSLLACAVSCVGAQNSWCNSEEEPAEGEGIEICLEPSVGPMEGGVPVTIRGMQRAADKQVPSVWNSTCHMPSWWQCTFPSVTVGPNGSEASPVSAIASSCQNNYVVCLSSSQSVPGNIFVSVSSKDSAVRIPSHESRQETFAYYGMLQPFCGSC